MSIKIEKVKSIQDLWNPSPLAWWEKIYWSAWRTGNKAYLKIYTFFYPNHQSIRDAIPYTWMDLDNILENVLHKIIISFVEEEKGLDQLEMILESLDKDDESIQKEWGSVEMFWDYYAKSCNDFKKLQEIYTWATVGKKAMENYLESVYNNHEEYSRVEKSISDRETEYLVDLVKLRKYLWT